MREAADAEDVRDTALALRDTSEHALAGTAPPRPEGPARALKRMLDVSGALAGLLALAPLLLLLGLLVRLDSPGPVLFTQQRVGAHGRLFRMVKFRTMVPDAEARLPELLESSDGNGLLFKMRSDPRVTRIGTWLRRFSLDELPQLLNVLAGDMSLVGPRPPLPHEAERFTPVMRRRQRVRPGMTGLWQVSGRSDLGQEESIRLDLSYVDHWSLGLDLVILARTFRAVVRAEGAY
ncbi:sugar transferase [Brevibacterium album]|uniref:sugar transferase n=1 Tax=Brevibacterium album TaxID=417948 RepID=UPI00042522CE